MTSTPLEDTVTRRRVLTGLGIGGVLAATGGLTAACSRVVDQRSSTTTSPAPAPSAFTQPDELESRDGRLEVTLTAASGAVPYGSGTRWAMTYNGTSPGPTLRVRPGDELIIDLENHLGTTTNLHTHGLHVSPAGDSDNVFVMVEPGERHTYRYRIPADHPSGTFWYHPHHHGTVARQVSGGLAGAIVVEDHVDALPALSGATERIVVLSDPRIGSDASVLDVSTMEQMQGREGDAILVNGLLRPRLSAPTGTLEHWRLVNASPSRFYALRLAGHQLHVVASDASRLAEARTVDELVLVPGERVEVLVAVTTPGSYELTTRAIDRGGMGMAGAGGTGMGGGMGGMRGGTPRGTTTPTGTTPTGTTTVVATVEATGDHRDAPPLPTVLRPDDAPAAGAVSGTREVTLSMAMGMAGGDQFRIDGRGFDASRVDISTQLGAVEDWTIRNTSPMDHPFHLHVWPFRVVERSDGAAALPGWKDTVDVPAGGFVRVRVPFRDLAGKTVYHCHILDHEDLGMMGTIDVTA